MAFIEWDDSYSVGHAEIDAQHKKLIAILGDFFDALKEANATDAQATLLEEFVAHAREHFAYEERELQGVDYHDLVSHRRQHEAQLVMIEEFYDTFHSDKRHRCTLMIQFLKKRFLDHIKDMDMAYARYFNRVKA